MRAQGEGRADAAGVGEPMLADIRRQPAVFEGLLARSGEIARFGRAHLEAGSGGCLYAFGCGDGCLAAASAGAAIRRGGNAYSGASALEFLAYVAPSLGPGDRALAISMSGNVDRTVEAAEAARRRKVPVAALTNGDGGRLGRLGLPLLSLEVPDIAPFLCGTSTYTATLLALLLAAPLGRGGDLGGRFEPGALRRLAAALPDAIRRVEDEVSQAVDALGSDLVGIHFLSAGPNAATAAYGAAKMAELTRLPAWSEDVEEFAHRRFWAADRRELIVYLSGNPHVARLAAASAGTLGAMGFPTLAVELGGCEVGAAKYRVAVPAVPEAISPLVLAIPLQLLAYYLARATGLDPNTRRHLKDDAPRFRASRELTRRSLVGTGR